jgi:hypothetical protein
VSTTSDHYQSDLQDHAETNTCEHCETEYPAHTQVRGFCSVGCFYRHKGANILDEIRRDHRLCATCFRQIKTVMPPAKDAPECAIGQQYQTEHTVWGVDDVGSDAYRPLDRQRWSCECGTVDPSERDDIIEQVELDDNGIVGDLLQTLRFLERSGAIDRRPSKQRLFEALREEWRDWEYAIGRALYE